MEEERLILSFSTSSLAVLHYVVVRFRPNLTSAGFSCGADAKSSGLTNSWPIYVMLLPFWCHYANTFTLHTELRKHSLG